MIYGTNPSTKLILEEQKAIKLFLWLFYVFYFSFDYIYIYIFPKYSKVNANVFPKDGLGYLIIFILILGLLPIAIYYIKKENPYVVKYILFIGYLAIHVTDDLMVYIGTTKNYMSGNIVELLFILFSPIFVNKKYFWTVCLGLIGKYIFFGLILQNSSLIFPIGIYIILSAIGFVLLSRFNSFISALTSIHEELRKKETLVVIGQMATAVAHEVRNPLSSLKGFTQLQQERHPNTNEFYPIMIQEIDRINIIVNDLMYLGKPKKIQFEKENIEEIIAYTLSIMKQQARNQGVNVETTLEGTLPSIDCDGKQLKQVFINLIKNAIEAMPEGGNLKINLKPAKKNNLIITIQDEGCGIDNREVLNLGEPFYTTKKDGTGLGLMVSKNIINDHKGELNIQSKIGEGTKVEVILPIAQ
jgi:signal transduction histidine kinase